MTRALSLKALSLEKNTAKHSVVSILFKNNKFKQSKRLQNTEKYSIFLSYLQNLFALKAPKHR